MTQVTNAETLDVNWKSLYRVGGVAALIAGVLFRRNIAAEIGLFSEFTSPVNINNWFAFLQSNCLLGLSYLHIFDIVSYALAGLMLLALYAGLKRANKSYIAIATTLGFVGIARIGLFSQHTPPVTINDWFTLLQSNRLLGLSYLHIFDLVNYALVGLMLLALYAALKRANKSHMAIATALGFVGIAVYFASNTAFSMLSLSEQYAAATTEAQKATLLAAGKAMMAINRFSDLGAHPGAGGYMSLLLVAVAGMITSVVMLRSDVFNRATAYVGILASALDLAYCTAFVFVPTVDSELLSVCFIPAAGLFWMIWHIIVGWRLYQLGRLEGER